MKTVSRKPGRDDRPEPRFGFGRNWSFFLRNVDEDVIARAENSLREVLGAESLENRRFLDAGCGSGLFSLAARRLGAVVHSFDADPESVECARQLKARYRPGDSDWSVARDSVLSEDLVDRLGTFDLVYCWGVVHHTGQMWRAIENVTRLVDDGGRLWLAVYNDQGRTSVWWRRIKRLYNVLPRGLQLLVLGQAFARIWGPTMVRDVVSGRGTATWTRYPYENRGMSPWRDVVDWVGGYPFEVARPEEVFEFCRSRGMELRYLKTCGGGRGCNEFVFERRDRAV